MRQEQSKQHADYEKRVVTKQTRTLLFEQDKVQAAANDAPPRKDNDDGLLSYLSACNIPILTELQRHETAPGAVGVRGIAAHIHQHDSSHLFVSVTAPQSGSVEFGAPLLSANLVEESDGNLQSTVSAAPPPAVVPQSMPDKTDELFVLSESESNR